MLMPLVFMNRHMKGTYKQNYTREMNRTLLPVYPKLFPIALHIKLFYDCFCISHLIESALP
jgi:hypothetical protein